MHMRVRMRTTIKSTSLVMHVHMRAVIKFIQFINAKWICFIFKLQNSKKKVNKDTYEKMLKSNFSFTKIEIAHNLVEKKNEELKIWAWRKGYIS